MACFHVAVVTFVTSVHTTQSINPVTTVSSLPWRWILYRKKERKKERKKNQLLVTICSIEPRLCALCARVFSFLWLMIKKNILICLLNGFAQIREPYMIFEYTYRLW